MPKYTVKEKTLVHADKVREPGSTLTLDAEQAHVLVVKGYLEPADEAAEKAAEERAA